MKEVLLKILTIAYASTGVVGFLAYLPTIKDLWRQRPSANNSSYIIWSSTAGIGFLYSIFVLSDLLFRMVSGVIFLACLTVLALSVRLSLKGVK